MNYYNVFKGDVFTIIILKNKKLLEHEICKKKIFVLIHVIQNNLNDEIKAIISNLADSENNSRNRSIINIS